MVLATWWFDDRQPSLESVVGLRRTRGLERDLSSVLRRATTTRNAIRCVLVTYASAVVMPMPAVSACGCGKSLPTAYGRAPGSLRRSCT